MPEHVVEVTRTVRLVVDTATDEEARVRGLDIAWKWMPKQAEGGDQGSATAVVVRAADLPGGGSKREGTACQPGSMT